MINIEIKTKLDELQEALLSSHPTLPTLLKDIHRTLKAQPEQVTLLSEQELNLVIQGLIKQTNSNLAAATLKASKSKKVLSKNLSLDDLGF